MKIINTLAFIGLVAAFVTPSTAFAAPRQGEYMKKAPMTKDHMMKDHTMMLAKSSTFMGVEVKQGSVDISKLGNQFHVKVSEDFNVPKSPAPHWQIVDKDGNTYLLNQFRIAGDKMNREITLPKYIKSVSKVQVWCSFAEVVLGEASFSKPISLK